jgi:hypothetical protein
MKDSHKKLIVKRMLVNGTVLSLSLFFVAPAPSVNAQSPWRNYATRDFSFDYPSGWRTEISRTGEVTATDPTDSERWIGVWFQAGAKNRASWAQLCQTLDDSLIALAQGMQAMAESINRQKGAGPFGRLDITFEGPHPGNPGTIGGRNIRISIVQNRGGFKEVLAWDQGVTAAARGNGIYFVAMHNPRSDPDAQKMWDRFVRSTTFTGERIKSSLCQ